MGIDLVDIFLNECKRKFPSTKFLKMDVRNLDFPANYFDAIWALVVLIHIEKKDIPRTLSNFYRVLRPGGKIMVSIKRGSGMRVKKEKLSENKGRLFVYFWKYEIEGLIKHAGFKIINSRFIADYLGRKDKGTQWIGIWAEKPKS